MKFLLTILLSCTLLSVDGQIEKGDFLIEGKGASLNTSNLVNSSSFINFDIDIGYFINKRWMAGTGIDLSLSESYAFVGNKLFGRYYFRDSLEKKQLFFVEGRVEVFQFSPIGIGQSNRRFKFSSGIISGGLDYFISKHLALEAQLDYYFLNLQSSQFEDTQTRSDFFTFDIRLQYFFRYRDFHKERLIDYRKALEKGSWFLGGRIVLHDRTPLRFGDIQSFNPLAGKFILKNLAIGTELNYSASSQYSSINLGLGPFSRYYLNVGRKKKIFLELKGNYQLQLQKQAKIYNKSHLLNYGTAVGWSNFINKDVSFDIIYSIFQDYNYNRNFSKGRKVGSRRGLSFAVQYFFNS